jgi:hypothetical protein
MRRGARLKSHTISGRSTSSAGETSWTFLFLTDVKSLITKHIKLIPSFRLQLLFSLYKNLKKALSEQITLF